MTMSNLAGQTVLVTGASTGIGAATAVLMAEAGADVGINYFHSKRAAQAVARKVEKLGRRALLLECDVCDPDQVSYMVGELLRELGRLDVLFANAGGLVERSPIARMSDHLWNQVIALNLDSVFYTVRAALGPMLKARRGSIILNASVAARNGGGGGAVPYAAAKGALVTFTRGLANEVAADGIRVNAVAPGIIQTPFHDKFTEPERMERFLKSIPVGRAGKPEDVARAVVWLAGERDGFITGEVIYITGGSV
jgi:3-oxoacyl-[acyl-carrier protein] reductase